MRSGKFLTLQHLTYGMSRDEANGGQLYFARVHISVGTDPTEYRAVERTPEGTVTAADLALRSALQRAGQDVPALKLWPYHVRLSNRRRGVASQVLVQASIKLDGTTHRAHVRHPDSVTAAAFALFDAYDRQLHNQWLKRLHVAGIAPEEILANHATGDR